MATLPEGLKPYRRTPTFTEATVPAGLLKAHSITAGSWGRIGVLEGKLIYGITDPLRPRSEQVLSPRCAARRGRADSAA